MGGKQVSVQVRLTFLCRKGVARQEGGRLSTWEDTDKQNSAKLAAFTLY
jgi:hypothetical protein